MAEAERAAASQRPTWFWQVMHLICFVYFVPAYRFRAWGVKHVPMEGPVLLVSNHQSFFDPVINGLPLARRRFSALARKTLFKNRLFAWLIQGLNAIPVDQENPGDLKAMRQCVDVLKRGQMLLIYPEGARTLTGRTEPFQIGTMLLIKRAKPTVVPVAIEGAYLVWPRARHVPRPTGRIGVMYGEPIAAETLLAMKPDEALTLLQDRVETMRREVAARIAPSEHAKPCG